MPRKSQLDQFAAELQERLSLPPPDCYLSAVMEWLKSTHGVKISAAAIGKWWERRQSELSREAILSRITSGAKMTADIEAKLESNPSPELETLIKLLRVILMNLTVRGASDPKLLETVDSLMKHALSFEKLQQTKQSLGLDERRVALLEAKAAQAEQAEKATADTTLSADEYRQRMRTIFAK